MNTIDFYAYQSKLRYLNGGYKVLFSGLTLLLCMVLNDAWVSITVILVMGMMNLCGNHLKIREYLHLLKIPIAFLLLTSAAIIFGISTKPLGDYKVSFIGIYIYLNQQDVFRAFTLFLRAMGGVSALYLMALSTPISELTIVLRKAHIPNLVIELMNMIYRFIFILTDVQKQLKIAAISRLGTVNFHTSCKSFGQIAGNLFLLSLKKADIYYDAMISRCYDGKLLFLEEEKKVSKTEGIGLFSWLMSLVIIWYMGKA
ncbi:MAG: cobalt ECF transporter T component CbiQ [Lachnospiraceae bacterium]